MAESTVEPAGSRLLARLPPEELERLLPHLEPVSFALGEVVYESGGQQSYIYFPTTVIISLLYLMENGSSASRSLWAATRCPTAPSSRARARPSG